MNKYELLYIIDNDLSEDEKQAVIDRLSAVVTTAGGEVVSLDKWGTRKYAYDIKFKSEGYYVDDVHRSCDRPRRDQPSQPHHGRDRQDHDHQEVRTLR